MEPNNFGTYKLKLKTLSPVFIGGRQENELNKWKYIKNGNTVYVVDELKLAMALKNKGKIDEFCNYVKENTEEENRDARIDNFLYDLKKEGIYLAEKISDLAKYSFNFDNTKFPSSKSIKTCIKDAFLIPYIPGSSIKGFIRTAILYDFLNYIKNGDNEKFNRLVEESIDQRNNKKADDKIIAETLAALARGENNNKEESYWDILKAIKISDAYPNSSNIIKGYNARVFGSHYIPIALEGIKEGVELTFSIQIDSFIIKQFKERLKEAENKVQNKAIKEYLNNIDKKLTLENLLTICNNFSSKIMEKEKEYAQNNHFREIKTFYENNNAKKNIIRIGYGSGLISTTIYLLMDADQIENVRKNFFKRKTVKDNFPKTRRYIIDDRGDPKLPFGWCSIEEVKNDGKQ